MFFFEFIRFSSYIANKKKQPPISEDCKEIKFEKNNYFIIFTLRFIKLVRASPFSNPLDSNAKSVSW